MSAIIATDRTTQEDTRPPGKLAAFGQWMRRNQRVIRRIQWVVVVFYAILIIVPAVRPLPAHTAHIWDDVTLFAQFLFWGIWWPFVLISMVLMGRIWCGVFCPEGSLSEWASRHGRGGAIPRWVRWGGWPFVAFVGTTVYGQMVSVYQYPKATLLILGGSTVGAIIIGYLYGRNVRVWCRYLCPVNGVFRLLSKLAPVHYRADPQLWQASRARGERPESVNCPTLLSLKDLQTASDCHVCGRCEGHRDAIALTARAPGSEIVHESSRRATLGDFILITFGLCGIAVGAFHWSASPWFVELKQSLAVWLIGHDWMWPLQAHTPWWIFTNYPDQNDVFNLLDGSLLLAYIAGTGLVMGTALSALLAASQRALSGFNARALYHLSHALIPLAGVGVFLGLSAVTVSMLRAEQVPLFWVGPTRAFLLAAASAWALKLFWQITGHYTASAGRRLFATTLGAGAVTVIAAAWWLLFWGW
ncbi:4Fe-4S binding protein [Marinobacter koreensis]|uniref:4Fe-4S binding protein n=1 Tax=Marinobacter koreensis TaxID=335974 RepID=A0ABW0RGP1_9GAMM|nr:4Fe-4S binding protein [Marinobacter koreensis]MCK7548192.1 4Fe-4S binding protein [Marinobacter koreensis]